MIATVYLQYCNIVLLLCYRYIYERIICKHVIVYVYVPWT